MVDGVQTVQLRTNDDDNNNNTNKSQPHTLTVVLVINHEKNHAIK